MGGIQKATRAVSKPHLTDILTDTYYIPISEQVLLLLVAVALLYYTFSPSCYGYDSLLALSLVQYINVTPFI